MAAVPAPKLPTEADLWAQEFTQLLVGAAPDSLSKAMAKFVAQEYLDAVGYVPGGAA